MFSGWNLAGKVLTWEQILLKINFHKNKGKIYLQWGFEQCIVKLVSWSGNLQYTWVQALRVSPAHPVAVPTEELTPIFTLKKTDLFHKLSWIRRGKKKKPWCLKGWRSLSSLEQLQAQG